MAEDPIPYSPPDFPESRLSPEATRTRRNLIAAMAVWALIVLLGLNPTEFTPLGIKFKNLTISILVLVSLALFYFWLSFVIYAYKDWKGWWHTCNTVLGEKKDRISLLSGDIDAGAMGIRDALKESQNADYKITINLPRGEDFHETEYFLSDLERFLPMWEAEKQRVRKQLRQLRTDIYARSAWDFWLPGLTIAGPIWHLLR